MAAVCACWATKRDKVSFIRGACKGCAAIAGAEIGTAVGKVDAADGTVGAATDEPTGTGAVAGDAACAGWIAGTGAGAGRAATAGITGACAGCAGVGAAATVATTGTTGRAGWAAALAAVNTGSR